MLDVQPMGSALHITGALDDAGARVLLRAVESARGDVQVDASGVERIDGAGLTALAVARHRCRADGRSFALTGVVPDAVRGLRARNDVLALFGLQPEPEREATVPARSTTATAVPRPWSLPRLLHVRRHRSDGE